MSFIVTAHNAIVAGRQTAQVEFLTVRRLSDVLALHNATVQIENLKQIDRLIDAEIHNSAILRRIWKYVELRLGRR